MLANDVQNHGNDTDIAVRFAGGSGYNIEDVRAIPVQTGRGSVFLGDLADVEEGVGPITIRRVNKERIINIQCNLTDRPLNEVVKELTQKLNAAGLKSTYEFRPGDHDERFLCRNGYGIVAVIAVDLSAAGSAL